MAVIKTKKINLKNIFLVSFFLITILINSGSAIILFNDNVPLVFLFLIGLYLIIFDGILRKKILTKHFITNPLFILSICIFLNMIIHFDFKSYGGYLRQILVFIVSILFVLRVDFKKFSKYFIKFIIFVTILSIIIWLLINVIGVVPPHLILKSAAENVSYNLYYNFILCFFNVHNSFRIMGPFWEPGVFASMLLFALIFNENMDYSSSKKNKNSIILIIGLLLTMSTAGYILLLIFVVYKITRNIESHNAIIFGFFLIIILTVMYIYSDDILYKLGEIFPNVFRKLIIESMSKGTRINSPLLDFKIFSLNPVFGVGMSSYQKLWPIYAREMIVESRTSTITYFLSNYGIIGILYFYTIITSFMKQKNVKLIAKICLMLIFSCIVMKEPHYVNLSTNIILLYFYYNIERKKV